MEVGGENGLPCACYFYTHTPLPLPAATPPRCHSANSTQLGRVVVSTQVLWLQRLTPVAFRLRHVATVSCTPIRTRLATSWRCRRCLCVGVSIRPLNTRASRLPASVLGGGAGVVHHVGGAGAQRQCPRRGLRHQPLRQPARRAAATAGVHARDASGASRGAVCDVVPNDDR